LRRLTSSLEASLWEKTSPKVSETIGTARDADVLVETDSWGRKKEWHELVKVRLPAACFNSIGFVAGIAR
jgi:hypothetical protein